ncbi:hypothetical protein K458DRAFT_119045 [Lentithecium fluviatile CBS 122367]|uniref:Uncharacterized protein n=1 Tax=Lentithecium fluviatile CBS 122367 TaxID=1168545 RepID=A0A6G1ILU3_9PLEO|nr:hypothetical protein K458DRAFT_119045 [Lentithecium fluviatile CBS 122367]
MRPNGMRLGSERPVAIPVAVSIAKLHIQHTPTTPCPLILRSQTLSNNILIPRRRRLPIPLPIHTLTPPPFPTHASPVHPLSLLPNLLTLPIPPPITITFPIRSFQSSLPPKLLHPLLLPPIQRPNPLPLIPLLPNLLRAKPNSAEEERGHYALGTISFNKYVVGLRRVVDVGVGVGVGVRVGIDVGGGGGEGFETALAFGGARTGAMAGLVGRWGGDGGGVLGVLVASAAHGLVILWIL